MGYSFVLSIPALTPHWVDVDGSDLYVALRLDI